MLSFKYACCYLLVLLVACRLSRCLLFDVCLSLFVFVVLCRCCGLLWFDVWRSL